MSTPYLFPSPLSLICLSSEHKLDNLDFHNIRKKVRISPIIPWRSLIFLPIIF